MADRYWRGGTGQWNTSTTTNWSATSGGAGGASVPTAADSVFFDDNSGTGTVTLAGALTCLDMNIARFASTITVTGTGTIACRGSLIVTSAVGVTWSATGAVTFTATTAKTLTTGGLVFACPFTFNGLGGSWQFQDDFTSASTSTAAVTLTAGTLDFNARTLNFFRFVSSGTGVRTIIATGSVINITGNASTILDFTTITNLTLTGWASNFTYAGAVGNRTISLGAFTAAVAFDINITSGADQIVLTGVARNIDFTGFSGTLTNTSRSLLGNFVVSATMTIADSSAVTSFTGTGLQTMTTNGRPFNQSITVASTGGTLRLLDDLTMGIRILALNSGTLDLNNFTLNAFIFNSATSSARTIVFGTTGLINLSGTGLAVWGIVNATGFNWTGVGRVNLTYSGALGTRAIAHGSGGGGTYATRPPPIYVTNGSDVISITTSSVLDDFIIAGGSPILVNTTRTIFGNVILRNTMTVSAGANVTTFAGPGTQTFDSTEIVTAFPIVIGNGTSTGTVFVANVSNFGTSNIVVTSGTLDTNQRTITAGALLATGSNVRTLDITASTILLGGANTAFQADSANLTVIATNSDIVLNNSSSANRVFAGGGMTYGTLTTAGGNIANTIVTGNNTFGAITTVKTVAQAILFQAASTTTVNNWAVAGTSSAPVTISSNSTAQHNLVFSGAGVVVVSHTDISFSNAAPSNKWYAPLSNFNTNSGNNTGWLFSAPPVGGSGNFFLMF